MNRFDKLVAFLEGIKDKPFTFGGSSDTFVIREFCGFGYQAEDERGNVIAIVDELDSTPEMLVFSVSGIGKRIKQMVAVEGIEFVNREGVAA